MNYLRKLLLSILFVSSVFVSFDSYGAASRFVRIVSAARGALPPAKMALKDTVAIAGENPHLRDAACAAARFARRPVVRKSTELAARVVKNEKFATGMGLYGTWLFYKYGYQPICTHFKVDNLIKNSSSLLSFDEKESLGLDDCSDILTIPLSVLPVLAISHKDKVIINKELFGRLTSSLLRFLARHERAHIKRDFNSRYRKRTLLFSPLFLATFFMGKRFPLKLLRNYIRLLIPLSLTRFSIKEEKLADLDACKESNSSEIKAMIDLINRNNRPGTILTFLKKISPNIPFVPNEENFLMFGRLCFKLCPLLWYAPDALHPSIPKRARYLKGEQNKKEVEEQGSMVMDDLEALSVLD